MQQHRRQLRDRRRSGFTLLELIVAMMIVAILATSLYACMRVAFKAQGVADAAVEPARTAELSLDLIRQDLGDAVAPTGLLAGAFTGTDGTDDRSRPGDDVLFYTTADSPQHAAANGEIKSVELMIMPTPNGNDHLLVRKVIRNLLAQQTPNPDIEVICRGVGGFNLRYFDGTNWTDTWDSTQEDNTLPAAVEVTLTLDRPNGNVKNPDGSSSFQYVRIIPLACSTAAYDTNVNSGGGT